MLCSAHACDSRIATTILSLNTDSTSTSFVVLSAVDLHAEIVGKQLSSLSLTKFPPPSTSHATAVPSLDRKGCILHDKVPPILLHHPHPTLNQCDGSILVEHAMTFQLVMGSLSHENLCLTKLYILFRKDHGIGLSLGLPNLVCAANATVFILVVCWFGSLL
jgi:hypothetical protein